MMRKTLEDGAKAMNISLSQLQLDQFDLYYKRLIEWNEKINLTAITDPYEVAVKHFLDSLAILPRFAPVRGAVTLIDVGTGAGFPGIPLKIANPQIQLTLLDSLQKRVKFLEEVIRDLELEGAVCVHGRAEELAHDALFRERFDIAVARAVAPLPVLLEYCSGYVKKGGYMIAYKGPALLEELSESEKARKILKMKHVETVQAEELPVEIDHFMAIFEKNGNLGLQYPRKQSKIKKEKLV